ncbi:MAG TPA: hypothetical protein VGG16_12205 [Streptosporangiaceae bacterium]|jgi:hypothetical protein
MDERGWGWTASQIRQIRLIEWVAAQSAGRPAVYIDVKPFYDALPDQSENEFEIAYADLKLLEEQRLITQASGLGGIESLAVMITPQARDLLEQVRAARANKSQRKSACRNAMVAWLYSIDATNDTNMPVRDAMLNDVQHGIWLAEPFVPADLADAAAWLHRQGLIKGILIDQDPGPVRLYLTDAGTACAQGFNSDVGRFLESQTERGSGVTVNIGNNSGPFQVAGDHAQQVQNIGSGADEIRHLIAGITEVVRAMVPGAADVDAQEAAALSAISDRGRADRGALERFGNWALSTAKAGATSGVVAVISSAVTALLMCLGHLG